MKKNSQEILFLLGVSIFDKPTLLKTSKALMKNKQSVDQKKESRIYPSMYEKLLYDKGSTLIQQEINDLFNKQC